MAPSPSGSATVCITC